MDNDLNFEAGVVVVGLPLPNHLLLTKAGEEARLFAERAITTTAEARGFEVVRAVARRNSATGYCDMEFTVRPVAGGGEVVYE